MRFVPIVVFVGFFSLAAPGGALADPPPPADLAAMLAEIDASNPEVLAASARVRAAREVPERMEALPDPKLSVSYTNDGLGSFTLGDSEFSNLSVGWEQDVPLKSVRRSASNAARADAEVARLSAATLSARLRARVISLYAEIYRLDGEDRLLDEIREILATEADAARARYESGRGSQTVLLRAQSELRRLDVRKVEIAGARRAAALALNETLGRSPEAAIGPALSLPSARLPEDAAWAERAGVADAAATKEAEGRVVRAEAAVAEAKSTGRPELSWLAVYQYRGSLNPMVTGGFGVRLPVWKSHRTARSVAESEADLDAARRDADAVSLRAKSSALSFANDVASADERLVLYRDAVIPEERAALEAARAAFSAGTAEMGTVLDALERLAADRREALALEAARMQAFASLEAATGRTLVDVARAEGKP